MKEDYYYLFGEDVVDAFNEGSIDDVILEIQNGKDFSTLHHNTTENSPTTLLYEYTGYSDFVEIDKLTYDQLQKAISEL